MSESTQHKLDHIRPPRVQITYDVETLGAIEMKELPFVAGILADLSGKPEEELPKVLDRKFVEIDRDNFNDILASINPRVAFQVPNKLVEEEDATMNVELKFKNIDDFDPVEVLKQVEPLRKLFETRQHLCDLLTKLDGNDDLDRLLSEVSENADGLKELKEAKGAQEEPAE